MILAASLWVLGYGTLALVKPNRSCPRCYGEKVVRKKRGKGMRPCARCHAHGRCRRWGAVRIHRMFWAVAGDQFKGARKADRADREEWA
jgi:hypothetical protein